MNTRNRRLLACQIEYHWWFIMRYRRRGNILIERGEPLTSDRLISLSKKIDHHGAIAHRLEKEYVRIMERQVCCDNKREADVERRS
jgi:hypothetical protein